MTSVRSRSARWRFKKLNLHMSAIGCVLGIEVRSESFYDDEHWIGMKVQYCSILWMDKGMPVLRQFF